MKRKIAMLAIGAMLAVALVGGGVYAYFNDTETSSGNQFTAGYLDLQIGAAGTMPMTFGNVVPGSYGGAYIQVSNAGSVNAALSLTASNMVNSENANYAPETNTAEPGDLGANMNIDVFVDTNGNGAIDVGESTLWSGTLNAFNGASISYGNLANGASVNIGVHYVVPTTVGNDIMGDQVTFDIVFTLVQV